MNPQDSNEDRIRELAREAALRNHLEAAPDNEFLQPDGIHVFVRGLPDWGFSTCPHPDCVLVRAAAAPGPPQTEAEWWITLRGQYATPAPPQATTRASGDGTVFDPAGPHDETITVAAPPQAEPPQGTFVFPHMCRDGHQEIGWRGDGEMCPVCREMAIADSERS